MTEPHFHSEIHRLLKLGPDLSKPYVAPEPEPEAEEMAFDPSVPFNLPIAGFPAADLPASSADGIIPNFGGAAVQPKFQTIPEQLLGKRQEREVRKGWSPFIVYPFVFLVAFSFFYVVLNFEALAAQVQSWFAKDEEETILQDDLTAYNQWISGYYFSIGDKEKLEPNNDVDFDGLSNLDEFTIKTNPTLSDSDGDGISDGIEAINGTNPWGSGKMTSKQKDLLSKIDLIKVNNRISFNAAASNLGAQVSHTENFDMTKPGRLSIPKLNLQVPLIWTQDPAQFDQDLTRGVVHYPGTALPGETGIVYVSGHSSDYFWKSHPYKQVFAKINALDPGDDIFIDVYGKDGKIYNYKYRVTEESIYAPDDQRQFLDNSGAKLNLSTCWPIGTQKDRYVVTAELQKL